MDLGLTGKVALVTGGASGIGLASATLFAREGARVVIADCDESTGERAATTLRSEGADVAFVSVDVRDEERVVAMVAFVVERFGRLDVAHNSAGLDQLRGPTEATPRSTWDGVVDVNLTGTFLCLKHEVPAMLRSGGGAIVNTASTAGLRGRAGVQGYTASKHGIVGLTRSVSSEHARNGIRVNAVCPGPVDTPMFRAAMAHRGIETSVVAANQPNGRIAAPEEIAAAVVWLASPAASYVTGVALPVDGGVTAH